jgi:hypothetical protein
VTASSLFECSVHFCKFVRVQNETKLKREDSKQIGDSWDTLLDGASRLSNMSVSDGDWTGAFGIEQQCNLS